MTAPAPERGPLDPPHDTDATVLLQWWASLPQGRRRLLVELRADEPLPQSTAAQLQRLGIDCPLVLLNERGRLVRRSLPSPAVLEFLRARS